jgi:hypothetical protein
MEALAEDIALPWDTVDPVADIETEPALPEPDAPDVVASDGIAPAPVAAKVRRPPTGGGALTIPLICLGFGLIAMCLLIPAADENRKLAYERQRLQADLEQLQKQVKANDAFLQRVADDPTLAERLARRQMKMVPEGTAVLQLKSAKPETDLSPFLLVTVPPPAPMPAYRPVAGFLATACRNPKMQLYLIGAGMMLVASGLVLSRTPAPGEPHEDDDLAAFAPPMSPPSPAPQEGEEAHAALATAGVLQHNRPLTLCSDRTAPSPSRSSSSLP